MYNLFKSIQYPIVELDPAIDSAQADILKACFIDFKVLLHTNKAADRPLVQLTEIVPSANELRLTFNVINLFDSNSALTLNLELDLTQSYATKQEVRFYFDESDCADVDSRLFKVEGYICFSDLSKLNAAFLEFGSKVNMKNLLEPSICSVVGRHRVDLFKAQYAKPLMLQTADSTYTPASSGVFGNVNFVPGSNCAITLQTFSNTVIISALRNANGTSEELCGIWSEPVAPQDTLCKEAVYSLGGAYPDDSGNLVITGEYPLVVTNLAKAELPNSIKNALNSYSHIDRVIYIGLPNVDTGVNCNTENVDNPCD